MKRGLREQCGEVWEMLAEWESRLCFYTMGFCEKRGDASSE